MKCRDKNIIKGYVTSGKKEGGYFLMKEGYIKQLKEKLGFIPYPGTLNIKAEAKLPETPTCILENFSEKGKNYGRVFCYKALLRYKEKEIACFVVKPLFSVECGVIEVMHEKNLREALGLNDRDEVELQL